ncbi:hypothetical protein H696_02386 [Fonticula alba]|uniref:protein-histidine N-methyltransferase n=1 Tax=Fonticula alba TaxID=691883 RepID=A0A058ZAJ3_FONAL|nr:hypothetical protein H696_02386 [Fonticula alba]KCV71439.1 hypothetical protein H696_02386 [Fonticula alba]|eukprot:XP_009494562.1 hypothetical protein H696_02386 [Fonticula alba]
MSGFRFNFQVNEADEEMSDTEVSMNMTHGDGATPDVPEDPAAQLTPNITTVLFPVTVNDFAPAPGISLWRRNAVDFESTFTASTKSAVLTHNTQSDLLPGVYEGGFKSWEASTDLTIYLQGLLTDGQLTIGPSTRVLELGCGSALPGIFLLTRGAGLVDFQDYNADVIHQVTLANIALNVARRPDTQAPTEPIQLPLSVLEGLPSRFFTGDWASLSSLLVDSQGATQEYDLLLLSETIYSLANYQKQIQLIWTHLSRGNPNACALVAAKNHYFGVGGNMMDFEQALTAFRPAADGPADGGPVFNVSTVWNSSDSSVPRSILKVSLRR